MNQQSEKFFEFNLNYNILVKLKEEGFQHWLKHLNRFLPKDSMASMEELKSRRNAEGYVEFQAWHFMEIFGSTIQFGVPPIFETTIKLSKADLKPPSCLSHKSQNDKKRTFDFIQIGKRVWMQGVFGFPVEVEVIELRGNEEAKVKNRRQEGYVKYDRLYETEEEADLR